MPITALRLLLFLLQVNGTVLKNSRSFAEIRCAGFGFYVDKKGDLSADLGIFTSPNTVLINRHGKEIGRIRGSVEWDDDEVIEYIYKIKAQNNQ